MNKYDQELEGARIAVRWVAYLALEWTEAGSSAYSAASAAQSSPLAAVGSASAIRVARNSKSEKLEYQIDKVLELL
jgi:hypothetical protein